MTDTSLQWMTHSGNGVQISINHLDEGRSVRRTELAGVAGGRLK